jgi:acyl-CoA thioesterase FadM
MTEDLRNSPPTIVSRRASFEGSNIRTWIGFKHLMYLMEEGVLEHFRKLNLRPSRLYNEYGLCFEVVYSGARIHRALHLDDVAIIEITPDKDSENRVLAFHVRMFAEQVHERSKILSGEVKALLRREPSPASGHDVPDILRPYVVDEIYTPSLGPASRVASSLLAAHRHDQLVPERANGLVWKREIPYFYCHFNERLQHSGYLRLLEEAVAIFLARCGMSIGTNLRERGWIPFVSHAELAIVREAFMEETIYAAFTVDHIYKNLTYVSRIDFYVSRAGILLHTATGSITHGYGLSNKDLEMVTMDEGALTALRGPMVRYEV